MIRARRIVGARSYPRFSLGVVLCCAFLFVAGAAQAQTPPQTPAPLVHQSDRQAFCANLAQLTQAALSDFATLGPDRPVSSREGVHVVGPVFRESSREFVRRVRLRGGTIRSDYSAEFRESGQLHGRMVTVLRECHQGVDPVVQDAWTMWSLADGVIVAVRLLGGARPMVVLRVDGSRR